MPRCSFLASPSSIGIRAVSTSFPFFPLQISGIVHLSTQFWNSVVLTLAPSHILHSVENMLIGLRAAALRALSVFLIPFPAFGMWTCLTNRKASGASPISSKSASMAAVTSHISIGSADTSFPPSPSIPPDEFLCRFASFCFSLPCVA